MGGLLLPVVLLLMCSLIEVCTLTRVVIKDVIIVHESKQGANFAGLRHEVFPRTRGNITAWTLRVCDVIPKRRATKLWDFNMSQDTSWYSKTTTRSATLYHKGAASQALGAPKGVYKGIHNEQAASDNSGVWSHTVGPFSVSKMRVAHFQNVVVTARGWIVNVGKCFALMSGGCFMGGGFRNLNRANPANPKPYILPNDKISTLEEVYPTFPEVISIAQSSKTWHFPMENLPALMVFSDEELRGSVVIHVKILNAVVVEWLKIGLGPNTQLCYVSRTNLKSCGEGDVKLIVGDIFAKSVIVPEMAFCGHPTREQFAFMHGRGIETVQYLLTNKTHSDIVLSNLTNIPHVYDPIYLTKTSIALLKDIHDHYNEHGNFDDYKLVVIMDRKKSRRLEQRVPVAKKIMDWCKRHGYAVYVFGDHMPGISPTVAHQLMIFNAATIVIGAHGGSETNAISMRPLQSCLIEMYPTLRFGLGIRGCYAPMAKSLSIHFYQIDYRKLEIRGSFDIIDSTMDACLEELSPGSRSNGSARQEEIVMKADTADTVGK